MKKLILSTVFAAAFLIAGAISINMEQVSADSGDGEGGESPCPTGVSAVTSSWWWPDNHTTYTMCGCQTEDGYESSGSC